MSAKKNPYSQQKSLLQLGCQMALDLSETLFFSLSHGYCLSDQDRETECGHQQLVKMARQALTWSPTHR